MSPQPHGTRARYASGCDCTPCRAANAEYERERYRLRAYGRWQPYIDAEPVRQHVRSLQAQGLGWRQLAAVSGISPGVIRYLLYGRPVRGVPPSRQIRREHAETLLAVRATPDNVSVRAKVDATGTRRRLQALVAIGWSVPKLAGMLGLESTDYLRTRVLFAEQVTLRVAKKAAGLYEQYWDNAPALDDYRTRPAVLHALTEARRYGWARPMAWDDETIDDPAARPYMYRELRKAATHCDECGTEYVDWEQHGGKPNEKRCLPCNNRRRRDARAAA